MVIPGYPDQFRNQMSTDPEVRNWAIHLAFNVTPRYSGEFTKDLLQAPWLWNNRPPVAEPVVTEAAAPMTAAVTTLEVQPGVNLEVEQISPTGSPRSSVKDENDDVMSQQS